MNEQAITTTSTQLEEIGQIANQVAARHIFRDYRDRRAENTLRRQDAALALFADFLAQVDIVASDLNTEPTAWRGIT